MLTTEYGIRKTEYGLRFMNDKDDMINNQLLSRGIKDERVLEAMYNVPRELFVPADLIDNAYDDGPLPIGEDQTISQPYIVALMTELLELKGPERVLEIGTGSAYQTAILASIAAQVYSVESIVSLAEKAKKIIEELGYENVIIKIGNGYKGWPEEGPFDAIIVTCAPLKIPEELIAQLKDGGRMVIPVGAREFGQRLILIKNERGKFTEEDYGGVMFVPMVKNSAKQ